MGRHSTSARPRLAQAGFTLVEAMVTIFVLSIGMLGLAFLQGASFRSTTDAQNRSQATAYAYDIMERLRVAGVAISEGGSSNFTSAVSESELNTCGTETNVLRRETICWYRDLRNHLPYGNARIFRADASGAPDATGNYYGITIFWLDRGAQRASISSDDLPFDGADGSSPNGTISDTECQTVQMTVSSDANIPWNASYPAPNPAMCMKTQTWAIRVI